MQRSTRLVVFVAVLMLAMPVAGHVPDFPSDNTAPERAVYPEDAVKSWSFYDRLEPGQAKYYRVEIPAGERLQVSTYTPVRGEFTPSLVVMSPAFEGRDGVPSWVTLPAGMGARVVPGERPATAGYEPFAPSANYQTASFEERVTADTTFLIAIYEPDQRAGPAGVAMGYRESFSAMEYALVPLDLVRVHLWEGQHPLLLGAPYALTLLGGLAVVRSRRDDWSPVGLLLAGAGLLVLASGVATAVQMGIALSAAGPSGGAVLTALFVVIPGVVGLWVLRVAQRAREGLPAPTRVGLAVAGGLAFATWAGFLVAPAVLVLVALLPDRALALVPSVGRVEAP